MGYVRQFYDERLAPLPKRQDQLAGLRRFHHSVKEEERREAIELLASFNDGDAARELIQLYGDCGWRSTRLSILRSLARHGSQRSLEFLFRIARETGDIPLAETAIWSLGQTHAPMAARFLAGFYRDCPEPLRPAAAGAIGQISDHNSAPLLLEDLGRAIAGRKHALVKNLVLTLGELKTRDAVTVLAELAKDRDHAATSLSAVVSLGKAARDARLLEPLEPLYSRDLLEYQIFSGALAQVRLRSQWTLEDYLTKLFDAPDPDRHLPLELNAFAEADVRAGLGIFRDPRHFDRLLLVMSRLDFPSSVDLYTELFDLNALPPPQLCRVLESLASHSGPELAKPLETIRTRLFDKEHRLAEPEVYEKWLTAVSLGLPSALEVFAALFESPAYAPLAVPARISLVNSLVSFALISQMDKSAVERTGRLLLAMLKSEKAAVVQGRILRAFGQMRSREEKAAIFVKESVAKPDLTLSCLVFLETLPNRKALPVLADILGLEKVLAAHPASVVRALAAQETLPADAAGLDAFLLTSLSKDSGDDLRADTLRLLGRHPRPALFDSVVASLKESERLQLPAIIALKSYGRESAAPALTPFLRSASPSLAGRALDTITSLPGLPAKVSVIDLLKDKPEDPDVCDKVVRCLGVPEGEPAYFTKIIDDILRKFPEHARIDGLIELRERCVSRKIAGAVDEKIPDRGLIDASLSRQIPSFSRFEEAVKSALRSAELPFVHKEQFEGSVDKASSILEFCKSLDIFLEKHLGRRLLFPKLESSLHEFQNLLHAVTLNEEYPSPERVLQKLGLEKSFTPESLPLSKMQAIARGILSGRIVDERFKVLDGLRAWAIMLLLFCRASGPNHAVTPLKEMGDAQIVPIARRLMALQDIRNPAAHRQTYLEFVSIEEVRQEVFRLLHVLEGAV